MADYANLLNPPKEPSALLMRVIDTLSWILPVIAAALSMGSGVEALRQNGSFAAILGIAAGIIGASGVIFTNWASRVRDHRLALAHSTGSLALEIADEVDRRG